MPSSSAVASETVTETGCMARSLYPICKGRPKPPPLVRIWDRRALRRLAERERRLIVDVVHPQVGCGTGIAGARRDLRLGVVELVQQDHVVAALHRVVGGRDHLV